MPDPDRLLRTLHQAAEAFRQTPGRRGRFVELQDVDEVFATGDLHGHVENFKKILERAELAKHPCRHLVLQEVIHGPFRYPGTNGDKSHQLLDLVAALKCQFPRQVHMLIGNHELSQWTERAIIKNDEDLNDTFRIGLAMAYGERANEIYDAYGGLFAVMPVALRTPNRVFLSHSVVGGKRLDDWKLEALFNEEYSDEDYKLGGCVHAVVWGRDISPETVERYLQKVDCDWLITGHIPCDNGFMLPNSRQIVLDCKDENACCCLFSTREAVTQDVLLKNMFHLCQPGS